jgi:zinc transport system substrate-binding protein
VIYVDPVYSEEYGQTLKNELERLSGESVQILKLYFMLGEIDDLDYFEQQAKNLENLKIGLDA